MSAPAAEPRRRHGYAIGAGHGLPGDVQDVKASGRATAGALTVMEITVEGGPPRHTHIREDESLYVLSGTLDITCGEDRFRAEPAAFAFLPRAVPHTFRSVDGPATALLIVTPGGLDEYFAELHAALSNGAAPAEVTGIQEAYGSSSPDVSPTSSRPA